MHSYRRPEPSDPAVAAQLWKATEALIASAEKQSALRRAAEKKAAGPTPTTEKKAEEEAAEKLRQRAADQAEKNRLLEKLIREEEARRGGVPLDLPRIVELPDSPARNTRSKTPVVTPVGLEDTPRKRGKAVVVEEEGEREVVNGTRRRTRKA